MAEHKRNKAGLHKGISSIFKGVPIPQADGGQESSSPPAPERTDYTEPKQPAPETQKPQAPKVYQATQTLPKAAPEHTDYTEPKQPAPEPQKPEVPKAYQATQTLPKAAPEHTAYTEPKQPAPETQKPQAPKAYQATQTLPKAAPEHTDYTKPKQPAPETQKPEAPKAYQATQTLPKAAPEHTDYTEPKQPAPETQKPQAPKAYQATQSLPKAATARQSKAEPVQKPKVVPTQQPKAVPVRQYKAVPTRQPKADIDKIDKNVSKKSPTVKSTSQSFWQQIRNKLSKPKPGDSTTKQKATVVMIPLLFIVLIFMLFRGGVFGTSAGHIEAPVEDTASGVATAGANTKIDWEIPAPYPTTLRDPMRLGPVETETAQTGQIETRKTIKLIVKGILYTEDNPSAVIGNSIVHEGETIRGVSIIKISKDSVEFEMNGKRWTQKFQR